MSILAHAALDAVEGRATWRCVLRAHLECEEVVEARR